MDSAKAKVIALLGVSGSGRSIVSRRLGECGFTRLRFSAPQRAMLEAGFGLTEADIDGPNRSKPQDRLGGRSPQSLLNSLSNDWGRGSVHRDLFTNAWAARAAAIGGLIYADDVQSIHEIEAVREMGGLIVQVTRPGHVPPRGGVKLIGRAHDIELVNTGLEAFHAIVNTFVDQLTLAAAA